MPLTLPPKPEPKKLRLHEAATRLIEQDPSLDGLVQTRLVELIASETVPADSEFQPVNVMTPDAEERRRAGLLGHTFADTWRLWLERGAQIDWKAGLIHVPGYLDPIPLPWIRWDILLTKLGVDLKAIGIAVGGPVFTAPALSLNPVNQMEQDAIQCIREKWLAFAHLKSEERERELTKEVGKEFPVIKGMRDLVRRNRPQKGTPGPRRSHKPPKPIPADK
jgi:hypothetical protein